jgi:hypothetical protein
VLLSERNPGLHRDHGTNPLPSSLLLRTVAIPGRQRLSLQGRGRAFSALLQSPQRAKIGSNHSEVTGIDPLYLFVCGLAWRKQSNASAGWELVRGLRSSDQTARIAAALLAQAENVQLPLCDRIRAREASGKPSLASAPALPDVCKAVAR